jgi:hypothetical protein
MKFIAEDDELTIELQGAEKFWALKSKLVIPRANITDLQWQPNFTAPRTWRLAGTDLPGNLWAGRFYGSGQKYFLYVHNPRGLTWFRRPSQLQNILSLTTHDYPYAHILLTCQPDIGASLLNWWQAG